MREHRVTGGTTVWDRSLFVNIGKSDDILDIHSRMMRRDGDTLNLNFPRLFSLLRLGLHCHLLEPPCELI